MNKISIINIICIVLHIVCSTAVTINDNTLIDSYIVGFQFIVLCVQIGLMCYVSHKRNKEIANMMSEINETLKK